MMRRLLGLFAISVAAACGPQPAAVAPTSPPEEVEVTTDDAPLGTAPAASVKLTASDGSGLRLASLDARGTLYGPLAFTELHFVFSNPEPRTREGTFAITLPDGAAVSRF